MRLVYLALMICLALMCSSPPAWAQQAQTQAKPKLVIPGGTQLAVMIKTAVVALNQANQTGNYSVLRDLAAPGFREQNSNADLAEVFTRLRKRNLDLGPTVLFQPQLLRSPWINERGILRIVGYFETRPEQVNFNLAYNFVNGRWRLFVIGITTSQPDIAIAPQAKEEVSDNVETEKINNNDSTTPPVPLKRPDPDDTNKKID